MTVLLIGSTGMLGQAILSVAKESRINIVGAARHNADVSLDLNNSNAVEQIFDQVKPSIVINAAAITNLDDCENAPDVTWRVNARSVHMLAKLCQVHRARFVQISTDHFYTGDGDALHDEAALVELVNEYAVTKFAGECFARQFPESLILRTNIVGFRGWKDRPTFIEWVVDSLETGKNIIMYDDYFVSSIDVLTFSHVLFDLLDRHAQGTLNVACREVFSKKDFIERFAQKAGLSLLNATRGSVHKGNIPRAFSLGLDVRKSEAILNRPLPSLDSVISSISKEYIMRRSVGLQKRG